MKYLSEIDKRLGNIGQVSYDEVYRKYTVEFDGENVSFTDEFFEELTGEYNLSASDIVMDAIDQLKKEISNNE